MYDQSGYEKTPLEIKQLFYLRGIEACEDINALISYVGNFASIDKIHQKIALNQEIALGEISIQTFHRKLNELYETQFNKDEAKWQQALFKSLYYAVIKQSHLFLTLFFSRPPNSKPPYNLNFYIAHEENQEPIFYSSYSDYSDSGKPEAAMPLLHFAVLGDDVTIVQCLLEQGVDITDTSNYTYNQLGLDPSEKKEPFLYGNATNLAIKLEHYEIVELILKYQTDKSTVHKKLLTRCCTLLTAVKKDCPTLAKLLLLQDGILREGVNINEIDAEGNTPLFYTLKSNEKNKEVFELLLTIGADIPDELFDEACTKASCDSLHAAAKKNFLSFIKYFLHKIDVNAIDPNGHTALYYLLIYIKNNFKNEQQPLEVRQDNLSLALNSLEVLFERGAELREHEVIMSDSTLERHTPKKVSERLFPLISGLFTTTDYLITPNAIANSGGSILDAFCAQKSPEMFCRLLLQVVSQNLFKVYLELITAAQDHFADKYSLASYLDEHFVWQIASEDKKWLQPLLKLGICAHEEDPESLGVNSSTRYQL